MRNGRFTIEVLLDPPHGGKARLVDAPSEDAALFYFFDPANWEMLVKVLDGCALGGHYWVFGAASTDVGYTVVVRDTSTGASREYRHTAGAPAPAIADTARLRVRHRTRSRAMKRKQEREQNGLRIGGLLAAVSFVFPAGLAANPSFVETYEVLRPVAGRPSELILPGLAAQGLGERHRSGARSKATSCGSPCWSTATPTTMTTSLRDHLRGTAARRRPPGSWCSKPGRWPKPK